jgi:hypothetical protein
LRQKTPLDLERAREDVEWIDDDDLRDLESKSTFGASMLGLFTWGGGRLYLGDVPRGIAALVGLAVWATIGHWVPSSVGSLVFFAIGGASAAWSYKGARKVNKYIGTRNELMLRQAAGADGYRLLAGAALHDPSLAHALPKPKQSSGPLADLSDRLRKLAALRSSGVINDVELRERKLDILNEAAPGTQGELDDMMYALLPLRDEGVLSQDDFDFLKSVGGER